ncbi:MAG: SDR family oxidoreductase [Bacteroidota bacterium]
MNNILLTASTSKIGQKLAIELARKGYNLALHYFKSESVANELLHKLSDLKINVKLFKADASDSSEVERTFSEIINYFGEINILINNIGIFPQKQNFTDIKIEEWNEVFNINLRSAFLFSQQFARQPLSKGTIINISSVGGLEHWKGSLLYNVSKSALIHLTKSLAVELAPRITVNCISPGIIKVADEPISITHENIPLKKYGQPQDILSAVNFFIENEYLTGQNIIVDGGYSLIRKSN